MSELKFISLPDISMIKNYRDVEPPSEKDTDVIELAASVTKHGIMQAVLLRPDPVNNDKYQLIFGHRRYLASKVAKLDKIPANIREIPDDDILELQVTENLQRKDVHPIDEAVAFKSLITDKKYSIEEIAARFGKKAEFIAQRLKLNDLIPQLQKDFKANKMMLGHALLLSRLTPADQADVRKNQYYDDRGYGSVNSLQEHITRNILQSVSSAPWKRDDADLVPAAGACSVCPKRSGNNRLLFADIKEDDRCFDRTCFQNKQAVHFLKELKNVIETRPEVRLVADAYRELAKAVTDFAREMKVPILKEGKDFSDYNYGSHKVKAQGFFVNGWEQGKIKTVYLAGKASKNGEPAKEDPNDLIAGIKQRTKRAAELDDEKVWKRIHEEVIKDKALINSSELSKTDTGTLLFSMYSKTDFTHNDKLAKIFGGGTRKQLSEKMLSATPKQFAEAARIFITSTLDSTMGSHSANPGQGLLKLVAEQYHKEKISTIEQEQKERRVKREARAEQRIKALKEEAAAAKPGKKEVKKPAAKKSKSSKK